MSSPFAGISLRPAVWGFFVSAGMLVFLVVGQILWRSHIESDWQRLKQIRERDLADVVRSSFWDRVESQREVGQSILTDKSIVEGVRVRSATKLASAFQQLERHREEDDASIDVVDTAGSIILWSGRSVMSGFTPRGGTLDTNDLVLVSQASLHRYLSVGLASADGQFYVFVSRPLETNYPVSNRFVSSQSLADDLSQDMGLSVRFVQEVAPRDTSGESAFAISLYAAGGRIVSHAVLPVPSLIAETQRADRLFDTGKSLFAASALCFAALLALLTPWLNKSKGMGLFAFIVFLWLLRIGWRYAGFPSLLLGGFLFDPAVHSSPFPLGIASSLGELTLSVLALLVTVILLLGAVLESSRPSESTEVAKRGVLSNSLRYGAGFLLLFFLQWVVRGYGAAIRSFVFDSTIRYQDPMSLLPNLPMIVMHFNILILTVGLVAAAALVFLLVSHLIDGVVRGVPLTFFRVSVLSLLVLIGYGAYLLVDQSPQLPIYLPLLLYGSIVTLLLIREKRDQNWVPWKGRPLIAVSALFLERLFLRCWHSTRESTRKNMNGCRSSQRNFFVLLTIGSPSWSRKV